MIYNNLSGYFKQKYSKKIKKICIDGGFTCPNRDGTCGYGGCIFCGERGAGEHIDNSKSIKEQVKSYFENKIKGEGFIAYFQNFTNTYAPLDELRKRYDNALIDNRIIALAIGTRPDCITEEIAELLASYKEKVDVWVELGLQTSNDKTADIINRCYKSEQFSRAVSILNRYHIPIVVHIIIGLPGETADDIKNTVDFINHHDIWGIKIHSLYVMKDTQLEKMYNEGHFTSITMEEYIQLATYVLTHINPSLVIHRLTGDCPKDMLVAPAWNVEKNNIINGIVKLMEVNGWSQGCKYRENIEDSV